MKIEKDLNTFNENQFTSLSGSVFEKSEWIAAEAFKKKPFKNSQDLIEKMIKTYKKIGYDCQLISAKYGNGVDKLIGLMKSKTCIISGHSGVGKSTLINSISPKLRLKTKEISSSHNQGKHTTTYAEMFDLDSNIRVIDTPGIRGFGLVDISKYELGDFFPEFLIAKQKCKFNNCLHLDEPGCNVKKKIGDGDIFESRYLTYLDMLKDQNIYRKPDESSNTES